MTQVAINLSSSQSLPFQRGISPMEELRKKMQSFNLQKKVGIQNADLMINEQKEMSQAIVLIRKDQEEMVVAQRAVKTQLKKNEQIKKVIQKDQFFIRYYFESMTLIWGQLSKLEVSLQREQETIGLNLKKIEYKKNGCLDQALIIKNNTMVMKKNLLEASQKIDQIQQTLSDAQLIQKEMYSDEVQIEYVKQQVLQQIKNLETPKKHVQAESKEAEPLNDWSLLLNKIINYSHQAFVIIKTLVIEWSDRIKNKRWSPAMVESSFALLLLGVIASSAVINFA